MTALLSRTLPLELARLGLALVFAAAAVFVVAMLGAWAFSQAADWIGGEP